MLLIVDGEKGDERRGERKKEVEKAYKRTSSQPSKQGYRKQFGSSVSVVTMILNRKSGQSQEADCCGIDCDS